MKDFFGEDYLLANESAKKIYSAIKDLPIIDYHCCRIVNEILIVFQKNFRKCGKSLF